MMLIDSGMTLSRSMVASDVGVTTPLRSITVTPSMPSALSWLSTLTAPPSTMTMWYGMSSAVRPGENRGRSFSSDPSIASSSDIDLAISRTGPAASVSSGCIACGSHFIQSHDGIRSGDAHSEIRRSSGEWNDAAWAIRACTRPRTARGSPAGMMRENDERETAIGRLGTVECARTNRRSAPAVIGSRSSIGLVSGGMSWTASRCGPLPMRMLPKSASLARRSHSRALITSDHSDAGSGLFHSSASRCCAVARRTFWRTCDR
jgi:hypothetical protein